MTAYVYVYFPFLCLLFDCCFFFFFKQTTAYEMRIRDWSSDVCSSDLFVTRQREELPRSTGGKQGAGAMRRQPFKTGGITGRIELALRVEEIGRASSRERVWQYV